MDSKIEVRRTVKLSSLTYKDWGLLKGLMPIVVMNLNREIERAINTSVDKLDAYKKGEQVLKKYEDCGAAKTKGFTVLDKILRKVYGY